MKQADIEKLIIKTLYGELTDFSPLEVALETGESTLDKLLAEDSELSSIQIEAARELRRLLLKEEEYDHQLGFSGYSDDINLHILSLLVDSISDEFKEGMRLTLGNLPYGEKIEQIKVDINLYTKKQIGGIDIKVSREVKVADIDATTDEFKAKYQVDAVEEPTEEEQAPEYNGEFIKVESSNLDSLAYNKEEKKILVKFKQGTVYSYEGCEEEDFKYIINATSVGSAFSDFKKKHTRYSRLK